MRLESLNAVVTGGNRGIGLELFRQLLAKGNTVVATAQHPAQADDLQALAAGAGGRLHVTQLDVSNPASVERWAAGVKALAPHVDMGSVDDNGSGPDYAYRASKAALNIVNKSLSIDLADEGITCVLLHPEATYGPT
ncbi:hypothetical protein C2E20_3850 isoform B [Micractinium conductrix]|uniref:Uncharacterized protein n=1 Tax=Micractinium conductrix TaxID=554055 RepID=A0A2P6VFS9_9CHLO|nr:hypothetical protein C2E20_3850 isoform B [Micractinium conductrix]|eukprot:PSC72929.1 hypothetical protein C2E20_3850 isoform B [Micractinium conductrix]